MESTLPVPARIALVVLGALLVQQTVVGRFELFGVSGDLMVVLAVAAGYHAGPERGAVVGFAAGLAVDLLVSTPLGLTALVYTGVGYGVGMVASTLIRASRLTVVVLAAVAAPVATGTWVLIGILFGQTHLLDAPLPRIALVASLVAALAALVVGRVVRWAVIDPHDRVRHAA
jgi:rod shape-determining protein MreD